MRIISKFKDYYDGARAWMDESITYVRKTEEVQRPDLAIALPSYRVISRTVICDELATPGVVHFCGKSYRYLKLHSTGKCYTDLDKFKRALREEINREAEGRKFKRYSVFEREEDELKGWLSRGRDIPAEVYIDLGCPVFSVEMTPTRKTVLIKNPVLKETIVPKYVHPWTAFQELSMFLGNTLTVREDPDIERTDELIRDQKGFDEWSFRKIGKKGKGK